MAASEEKVVGEKGKGKEQEQTDEPTTTTQDTASTTPETAPPSVPEKDAAPVGPSISEKDAPIATPSPPRNPPPQVQPPLQQPLPPPHPHANGHRASRHPEIFPVNYYDPGALHPQEPEKVTISRGWQITKLFFSSASLICSAVVIGLGVTIAQWGGKFSIQEAIFGITTSTAGLAILWTAIDHVVTCASNDRHHIHPGAHVAIHLIIWLMAVFSVCVVGLYSENGYYYDWSYLAYYQTYEYEIRRMEAAILAFMVLLLLIHFFLFVRACVETHEVNMASRRFKNSLIRYITVQPNGAGGVIFTGMPPGYFPQPLPNMSIVTPATPAFPGSYPAPPPAGAMGYGQPQGKGGDGGLVPPQQAVLYGGYYAPPAGTYSDPSAYGQPSPAAALHGYYGPPPPTVTPYPAPPRRHSSGSRARHSQRMTSAAPPSGSGSRRDSGQNTESPSS